MNRRLKILIAIAALLAIAFVFLRTPETDMETMRAKYGGELARYTEAMGVHYRDQGNPDGAPIIFIHGSSASLHTWEPMIAAMGEMGSGYRLISYDQPGHGLTGPHLRDDYSAAGMTQALDDVMDELGIERAVLIGNSMGGWVSWRYALDKPERVKALVLMDAGGAPTTEEPPLNLGFRLIQNPITRPFTEIITPRAMVKTSLEQTVADPDIIDEDTVDLYWELLRYPGNRKATSIRAAASREPEYGARLSEIETPSLIIWGDQDRLVYVSSAYVFDQELPNSELIIYENIGHLPMFERPKRTAKDVMGFLKRIEQ